jgi:DNA-binding NtrC family response regulator
LMYRLNVVTITLPPLRARGDDIRLLAQHFVSRFAQEFKKPLVKVTDEVYALLRSYAWPGNVRELRNVIERAVLLCRNNAVLPDDIVLGRTETQPWEWDIDNMALPPEGFDFDKLRRLESHLLRQALERTNSNQTQAAKLLNLSRDRLRYRLQKHGLL